MTYRAKIVTRSSVWERIDVIVDADSADEAIDKINDFDYDIEDSTEIDYSFEDVEEILEIEPLSNETD